MATKVEPEYPSSPNEDSEGDGEEEEPEKKGPVVAKNVAELLKKLHSTGAILKKPKQEYLCKTCDKDFTTRDAQLQHLLSHVSLPSVVVDKLPSDDEDAPPSGDDWSDEEEELPPTQKTPQKIDISQIMQKTGISIKNTTTPQSKANTNSALSKLTGLGFTIKKNSTPIKEEKNENDDSSDVMKKLGKLGGIKLKLKSEGGNSNNFQVVNGLKDFKTSDDEEDDDRGFDSGEDDFEKEESKVEYNSDEQDLGDTKKSDEDEVPAANKNVPRKIIKVGQTLPSVSNKNTEGTKPTPANVPLRTYAKQRPAVKQTPRRGANLPIAAKTTAQAQVKETSPSSTKETTPERRESHDSNIENVTVKQEIETGNEPSSTVPLFSGQIKEERSSPPPTDGAPVTTPIIAQVKTENEATTAFQQNVPDNSTLLPSNNSAAPIMPVPKKEEGGVTVIEINGDSDGDDDCCVVSATPASDVKPVIPKTETITPSYPPPAYSTSQSTYSSTPGLAARLTAPLMEKQHNFNWNAPDSKPAIDILEKSTDDMFDSLFSGKRDNSATLADASEYISLDTLGPQHSCEVCNTRFTSLALLDDHKKQTGHSSSLVMPTSSTLLPYNASSNILSTLLPVKHLAEQVGKLSTIGTSGSGFTHQQNVMINIQAYPGAGGMAAPQGYNSYGQNVHSGYQQSPNNMYNMPGQGMAGQPMPGQVPGQYPNQNFMGQQGYGQQFGQQAMPKPGYPGSSSPYSTASPLQSMQQAVYGQSTGFNNQMGQMGPPGLSQSNMFVPASSPSGIMKPPATNNVQIQNVQTFPPGQLIGSAVQQPQSGDMVSGQMRPGLIGNTQSGPGGLTAPGQVMGAPGSTIRMAPGANISGTRPRMPTVRGVRPSIRPGVQVQGQLRGAKPRMPIKRAAGAAGGPGMKRRNDMLLPGKHDNEDCQVMAMQKQRQGMPMIESVQGAKDKLNLGSQISITKKTVNKEANAMANVLASRGISIKQKQKSRSPSPERPIPHIPNLGAGVSIKHTSKSSSFSIPEAKVGGGMQACKICKKMFMNVNSLAVHMSNAHAANKSLFKCDECPASYPRSLQLQHHKRVFHNVNGPNKELGLPVVDLSQEDSVQKLSSLGIYSFIPLANREQDGGCFGIPVISVHNMQNGMTRSLQALGADGLLSLGPLKPLPNT